MARKHRLYAIPDPGSQIESLLGGGVIMPIYHHRLISELSTVHHPLSPVLSNPINIVYGVSAS